MRYTIVFVGWCILAAIFSTIFERPNIEQYLSQVLYLRGWVNHGQIMVILISGK